MKNWLAVCGLMLLLLIGPSLQITSSLGSRALAQSPKYAGPKLCTACHKGMHAEVITATAGSGHVRALWKIEEQNADHIVVGEFPGTPPFPKDRIAYVLGSGLLRQAYLDTNYKVLPAEWMVKEKQWQAREAVDATHDCLGCHTTGYDPAAKQWAAMGVTCEACHGPGSTHASAADKKGSILRPQTLPPDRQAMLCGQCHSVGKSKDGQFTFPQGYRPGDDLNVFFVLSTNVPEGSMNSQYNDMVSEGKHLAAGTVCTTCHLGHGAVGTTSNQLRKPITELCLGCHEGKLTGAQHAPAVLKAMTCAVCHMPKGKHTFVAPNH